jgi:hypothetical protein
MLTLHQEAGLAQMVGKRCRSGRTGWDAECSDLFEKGEGSGWVVSRAVGCYSVRLGLERLRRTSDLEV